ncbi:MAG: hypothetical protein A3H97_21280 [Acidobacteria bacterium RIFCSPLOWO2_02_FULL_65_29]|nr:MAG: hypothetical protein A3H97_21280 [Acidobacteria bacterium RIFCSPLOWO2_02_FULL_65_29]
MKFDQRWIRPVCALSVGVGLLLAIAPEDRLQAHGTEARYVELTQWKKPHFSRVFGVGTSALGVPGSRQTIQMRIIENKACLVGNVVALDVDDAYAFDVDEPVTLTLTYAPQLTTPFVVGWDKSGGTGVGLTEPINPEPGATLRTVTVTLDRARLAGQGTQGTDIAVGSRMGLALCDVELTRSGTTKPATSLGQVRLTVKDPRTGRPVPARVGVYDETGRAPLASDKALMLQRYADDLRMLPVNDRTFWPSANRQAFYVDGNYEGRLPEGKYELVVTRGPEYRAYHGAFDVRKDETSAVTVTLERYADLPGKGWYSGDSHIHLTRDEVADPLVWGMVAAEDVYVGNLLEMGNITGTHFKQPALWGDASRFAREGHYIVSGQEDPRTGMMGHTIHHNLERPIHLDAENYFFYNRVFEQSKKQGGTSGFAHMGSGFNGQRGLALTVPFGLVNFIEVLQAGRLFSDVWYRFLNLGYRISPAAGSDWPYSDFPGVVRNYVKLNGRLDLDAWFESFHAGHVYVSNGPFLEFTVNGRQMGEELRVKRGARLDIAASTQLNPDVDKLNRLELVILGDVAATVPADGKDRLTFRQELKAERSMWIAVRALGERQDPRNMIIAHSAPIYVVVDGEPSWKASAVSELVAYQRAQLQDLLTAPLEPLDDLEVWETRDLLLSGWEKQRSLLQPTVDGANALYQKLLDRLSTFSRVSQR